MSAEPSARTQRGGCLCGAVRYEAAPPAESSCFCHCASCRRSAGATPVAWATFPNERFRLTQGVLAVHESSPPVERGFCGACGTTLTYARGEKPRSIDVTIASFDEPALFVPDRHIWVSDRVAWTPLADGLPQFPGWSTP